MIKIERYSVMNLENAIRGARNPLNSWARSDSYYDENGNYILGENDLSLAKKLAKAGSDHRKYLRQIFVSVDITAPLYWWKEAQRYHWFDFVSSQSTMNCLLKFDIATQVVDDTDPRVVAVIQELINEYNLIEDTTEKINKWRQIVASLPWGFCLGATMTTNYQQLKTMYRQRVHHKLKEWHVFCDWCLTLPMFDELTGVTKLKVN